jgi:hypothetical protein
MRAASLAISVLLVAVLLALAAPGDGMAKPKRHTAGEHARASAGQLRGVNLTPFKAFIPGGQSDADNAHEVQSACELGAGLVRVFVSWPQLEPSPGQVSDEYASQLDSLMSQAAACGMRVMFTLVTSPSWNTSAPAETPSTKAGSYPPGGTDAFQWIVSWILQRWPTLQSLEVWNEPNYQPFWYGTPADYAGLVDAAVAAKREVGSSTLILAGALATGSVDDMAGYLNQVYAAGMIGEDGISIHPYSMNCPSGCRLTGPAPARSPFRAAITRIHDLMVRWADPAGLWLTEFGFASCPASPTCVPEGLQASWMAKSIRIAACYPYVSGLTAFTIRDIAGDPQYAQQFDAHFGLLRSDFSPKPAFAAVAAAYRGAGRAAVSRSCRRTRG